MGLALCCAEEDGGEFNPKSSEHFHQSFSGKGLTEPLVHQVESMEGTMGRDPTTSISSAAGGGLGEAYHLHNADTSPERQAATRRAGTPADGVAPANTAGDGSMRTVQHMRIAVAFDRQRALRPTHRHHRGSKREKLHRRYLARVTLGRRVGGDVRESVRLPPGESEDEWIATHIVDFYNEINIIYGTIREYCNPESCPCMSAGPKYVYKWADGTIVKTPIKVPANEYTRLLMEWVEQEISDTSLFVLDSAYPPEFRNAAGDMFKRLFRVYAHMYHSHFAQFVMLGLERHLNTCFKRFIYFVKAFKLVDARQLAPLQDLISRFEARDKERDQALLAGHEVY